MKDYRNLLKNNNFVSLWSSQMLSQMTINIMNFLLLLRLFQETGSTIATSLLWVAYALPAILVGPFAAASVDMVDRKKTLMITNLAQSLVIFVYALSHHESIFLLYGIAIIYSFFNQFYVPAEQASLPSVVSKPNLPLANGVFFATQQAAIVLGFGLAGVLSRTIGFDQSLFLSSILLFGAFLAVSMLPDMKSREIVPKSFEKAFEKFFERIVEGYQFLKDHYSILAPFLLLMGLQVAIAMLVVNVPLVATDLLGIRVDATGLLVVVPVGLGTLVGAFVIPRLLNAGRRKKGVIEGSLAALTAVVLMFAFVVPTISAFGLRIGVSGLLIAGAGLAFMGIMIPSQTFIQEKTPGGLRGRVFGNFWFLATIATVFPTIFSGAISELFGIRILLLILSAFAFVSMILFTRFGKKFLEKEQANKK